MTAADEARAESERGALVEILRGARNPDGRVVLRYESAADAILAAGYHADSEVERLTAQLQAAQGKLADAQQSLVELQPDPVLVEGSWFAVKDLPMILGNHIRSVAELAREVKSSAVHLQAAQARLTTAEAIISRARECVREEYPRSQVLAVLNNPLPPVTPTENGENTHE